MRKTALVALALLVTVPPVRSQKRDQGQLSKDSIEISHAKLRLGMTKAEVTDKLSDAQIDIKKDNLWVLHSGSLIQFQNGKVSYVSREWTAETDDLIDALFRIISYFNLEGDKACSVITENLTDPNQDDQKAGISVERVQIKCGDKSILIAKYTDRGTPINSVRETLGTKKRPADTSHRMNENGKQTNN